MSNLSIVYYVVGFSAGVLIGTGLVWLATRIYDAVRHKKMTKKAMRKHNRRREKIITKEAIKDARKVVESKVYRSVSDLLDKH